MKLLVPSKLIKSAIILKKSSFISNSDLYLASSIVLETACTLCLPNANINKMLYLPIYSGYGLSFYLLPKCLDKYSLNTAYTLWSAFGIIITLLFDIFYKKHDFHKKQFIGVCSIIYGIFLIK